MDPATMAMMANAAGKALATPPAGPASAKTNSTSAQDNKLDGANWSVNYGGAQIAGGMSPWLIGGAVLIGIWLFKKR